MSQNILQRWSVSAQLLTEVVDENPSLRGMLLGYVAEAKLEEELCVSEHITHTYKHDDHDRRKKGDRVVVYHDQEFVIECKSLQTNSIRRTDDRRFGKVQCDASDRRPVTLPTGTVIETTCLQVGEFDILAVNLFAFDDSWRFIYAKNSDLPRSSFRKYPADVQQYLLATLIPVTWPPEPPFTTDPYRLLDELIQERAV